MSKFNKVFSDRKNTKIKPTININNILTYSKELPKPILNKLNKNAFNKKYTNDLNIIEIHEEIVKAIGNMLYELPFNEKKLNDLENKLLNNKYKSFEINVQNESILQLKEEIKSLKNKTIWNYYINNAIPLLDSYIPLASNKIKGRITVKNNDKETNFTEEQIKERLIIISKYINLISEIVDDVCIVKETNEKEICPECSTIIKDIDDDSNEDGTYLCKCGYQIELISSNTGYDSVRDMLNIGKQTYAVFDTFESHWYRHQGQCNENIPEYIFLKADSYFSDRGILTRHNCLSVPLNNKGRRQGTSISNIIDMFKANNLSEYYKFYNVFGRDYYGWILPKYNDIENIIFTNYYETQAIISQNDPEHSSINGEVYMCLLLLSYGIDVNYDQDFKTMGRDAVIKAQNRYKDACEILGKKYKLIY